MDASALDIAISALEKDLSILEASIDGLENWLWLWSGMVAVGVLCEIYFIWRTYREERAEWSRGIVVPPSKPSILILSLEIVSVLLVVIGIVGELWVGVVSANRNTDLRNKNNRLVALIRDKAGLAGTDAVDALNKSAAATRLAADAASGAQGALERDMALRKEAEKESESRLALAAAHAPRRLSPEEKSRLSTAMRPFGPRAMTFGNENGNEPADFLSDIIAALQDDGWLPIRRGQTSVMASSPNGVTITSTPDESSAIVGMALAKTLENMGYDAGFARQDSVRTPPQIGISVWERPVGPQGEAKLKAEKANKQQ